MELTDDEKALYDELIVQITVWFPKTSPWGTVWEENEGRENRFDFKNCVIEHGSISDFEAGCIVLRYAEVAAPLDHDGSPKEGEDAWSGSFRIRFDVEELRAHLAEDFPPTARPLGEVIETFLGLTTHYGDCPVPTGRAPFAVPEGFMRTFACFERCGYVQRVGEQVKWTEKMQPHMRAHYHWDEDGRSEVELYEAEVEEAWRTMPRLLHMLFFPAIGPDVLVLEVVVKRFWDGERWQGSNREFLKIWIVRRICGAFRAWQYFSRRTPTKRLPFVGSDLQTARALERLSWESRQ
ncbi:MAG: hypothetical protein MI741_15425 [Rhodospirillales bacterium]|nr:hypothetical protein [Rhodospirillales bacterium]